MLLADGVTTLCPTSFMNPVNFGSAWNKSLVRAMGETIAWETRALWVGGAVEEGPRNHIGLDTWSECGGRLTGERPSLCSSLARARVLASFLVRPATDGRPSPRCSSLARALVLTSFLAPPASARPPPQARTST
jgi:hypothetical protein